MSVAVVPRLMETAGRDDAWRDGQGVAHLHGTRRGGEQTEALKQENERGQPRKPTPPHSITPAIFASARQSLAPV